MKLVILANHGSGMNFSSFVMFIPIRGLVYVYLLTAVTCCGG